MQLTKADKTKLFHTLFFPAIFILICWLIKISEVALEIKQLFLFGVYPRELSGLKGILFAPFIHGGWDHLLSNTIPVFLLLAFLFFFYRPLSYKIFFFTYLLSGLFCWIAGRPSYHIGASGLIYALAMFLFVSGILRKDLRLMGIAALVVFLYGSIFMGMFPVVKDNVSWESHLGGGLSGLIMAFAYKNQGPQRPLYSWEVNPLSDEETDIDYMQTGISELPEPEKENPTPLNGTTDSMDPFKIIYTYKEKEKGKEND